METIDSRQLGYCRGSDRWPVPFTTAVLLTDRRIMKLRRTKDQLTQHLVDQLIFLGNSARLFDEGCWREAVRMAVQLRILFYDKKKSKSLVTQLDLKEFSMKSAIPGEVSEEQKFFHGYGKAKLVGDRLLRLEPDLSPHFFDDLPVQEWWNQPIWKLNRGTIITRASLILNAADTDGGAHVDPAVKEFYADLSAPGAGGWYLRPTRLGSVLEYSEDAHLVALREIAHEVLHSPWESLTGIGPAASWYKGHIDRPNRETRLRLRKSLESHYAGR